MVKLKMVLILPLFILSSCNDEHKVQKLQLTNEQLVDMMVNLYTINSAVSFSDEAVQDSTRNVYYSQLAEMTGLSMDIIKSDFDLLLTMPDSLQVIQSRAIDTLRIIQEKVNMY